MREKKGFKFYLLLGLVLLGASSTSVRLSWLMAYYVKINGMHNSSRELSANGGNA